MTTSDSRRKYHRAVSVWLCDMYGDEEDIPPFFWRDADDLLKFLKANGWCMKPCTSSYQEGAVLHRDISSPVNLQAGLQEGRRISPSRQDRQTTT